MSLGVLGAAPVIHRTPEGLERNRYASSVQAVVTLEDPFVRSAASAPKIAPLVFEPFAEARNKIPLAS